MSWLEAKAPPADVYDSFKRLFVSSENFSGRQLGWATLKLLKNARFAAYEDILIDEANKALNSCEFTVQKGVRIHDSSFLHELCLPFIESEAYGQVKTAVLSPSSLINIPRGFLTSTSAPSRFHLLAVPSFLEKEDDFDPPDCRLVFRLAATSTEINLPGSSRPPGGNDWKYGMDRVNSKGKGGAAKAESYAHSFCERVALVSIFFSYLSGLRALK